MTKLSQLENREFIEDARSESRRQAFAAMRKISEDRVLSPDEFVKFLDWSQTFMTESPKSRKGDMPNFPSF